MAPSFHLEYDMNKYKFRVDRVRTRRVPAGMMSIRYLGNSIAKARAVFESTIPGKNAWGEDNPAYGVVLSEWDTHTGQYEIFKEKGLP